MDLGAIVSAAQQAAQERETKPFDQVLRRIHAAVEHTVNTIANEVYIGAQKRAPVRKVFKGANHHGGRSSTRAFTSNEAMNTGLTPAGRALASKGSTSMVTRRSRIHGENPFSRGFSDEFLANRAAAIQEQRRVNRIGVMSQTRERAIGQADFSMGGSFSIPNAREVNIGSRGRILGLTHGTHIEGDATRPSALSTRGNYELRSGRAIYTPTGGVPQLGGRLKKEIDILPMQRSAHVFRRVVVSPTPYAKYVEFGTRHAAAQPYLRPALAAQRERFVSLLRDQLRRAARETKAARGASAEFRKGAVLAKVPKRNDVPITASLIDQLERSVRRFGGGMV